MMGEPMILKAPILEATPTMNIANMTVQWLLLEGHCEGSSMIYVPQEMHYSVGMFYLLDQ